MCQCLLVHTKDTLDWQNRYRNIVRNVRQSRLLLMVNKVRRQKKNLVHADVKFGINGAALCCTYTNSEAMIKQFVI